MSEGASRQFGAFGSRLYFEGDGFVYAGRHYPYATVRGIEFKQRILKRPKDASGKGGETLYESLLRVTLASNKHLNINVTGLPLKRHRTTDKQVYDSTTAAADWLGAYTFDARMDAYMEFFTAHHYWKTGAYEVAANGDLFHHYAYCLNMRDTQVRCLLYPHHMSCSPKPRLWWKKLLALFVKSYETLDLRRDRDCFLYFLRKNIGLNWPDEKLRLYRGKAADGSTDKPKEPPQEPTQGPGQNAGNTGANPGSGQQRARENTYQQQEPPKTQTMPTYPQHLAKLGLGPDVKWDVVRTTYRLLARQNHPDLMRGRGANAVDIKAAEERLKVINESYSWLEDFYKLKKN